MSDFIEQTEKLFDLADTNNSGRLSFSEWQYVHTKVRSVENLGKIKILFDELDEDNSNSIDVNEFKKLFNFSQKNRAEKFFSQIDVTCDGTLQFTEFVSIMDYFIFGKTIQN